MLFGLYITSIVLSYVGKCAVVVPMVLELKKAGYKIDVKELNDFVGDVVPKESIFLSKIAPFIPAYNIAETLWFMKEIVENKDLIYMSLYSTNSVKEIEVKNEPVDSEKEEAKLNNVYGKIEALYLEYRLSNKDISDSDLDMLVNTLNYVKREAKSIELLDKVSKLESMLLDDNKVVYRDEVSSNIEVMGNPKVKRRKKNC